MAELPPNLREHLGELVQIVKRSNSGKKLTRSQQLIIDDYTREHERAQSVEFVRSQKELAAKLGCEARTIQRWGKDAGCPGKEAKGYCVQDWQRWRSGIDLSTGAFDYSKISADNPADIAEQQDWMHQHCADLYERLRVATERNDMEAAALFQANWLKVSEAARRAEQTIQRFQLETGELIERSEMDAAQKMLQLALMHGCARAIDELALLAERTSTARQFTKDAERIFEAYVKKSLCEHLKANKLDPRVLQIWEEVAS
ncbi:MAG: hypothetical protein AAF236_06630 [Verrucomicrobiota bacterium]